MSEQSIIALSSPRGKGAIALIRLSGDNALTILDAMSKLPRNKKLCEQKTHTIHYGWTIDKQGEKIDQVLFAIMKAPRTFTGQNTVEITCHNNPFIIENIIQQAITHGARQALPGEFTRRAFENKKLDLIQAEAINELLCAQTETALKKSLAQLEGSLSNWIGQIEQQLLISLAWSEASFEFLDDEGDFGKEIKQRLGKILQTITHIKKTFTTQQQIREGFRIALIGSVNAGKSSLFNRILQLERSIVTDIAGTTRDSVEAGLYRNGNYWTLIDTAGLRQTEDKVERLGIKRSFDEAHKADIVVLVLDGSRNMTPEESVIYQELTTKYDQKNITVITKSDQPLQAQIIASYPDALQVSSSIGTNCEKLETAIESRISKLLEQSNAPFLVNQRQLNLLVTLEQKLLIVDAMLKGTIHYELISHHLREALEDISQLTGKSVTEAAMDMVFKEFCVGK
jgi:tRNA modification GTPase